MKLLYDLEQIALSHHPYFSNTCIICGAKILQKQHFTQKLTNL